MAHIRKQLRDAAVAVLTAGIPAVAGRVFASRVLTVAPARMPAILVYTADEQDDVSTITAPRLQKRTINLVVIGLSCSLEDTIEDDLDALAASIEAVLLTNTPLAPLARDLKLTSIQTAADSGDEVVGHIAMVFSAWCASTEGKPESVPAATAPTQFR